MEFLIPNHKKSNSPMVKKILEMSNFQSGKYYLNLLDYALSDISLHGKSSPQFKNPNSGEKNLKKTPSNNQNILNNMTQSKDLSLLKTNKVMLNEGIVTRGSELINRAFKVISNFKERGIIDFELDDEIYFL